MLSRAAPLVLLLSTTLATTPTIALHQRRELRFIVTGDAGATHSALRAGMQAVMRRTVIDGILLLGDNFYPCGVSGLSDPQWSKITAHFGATHLPIYPVLGNHDYGDQQERGQRDYWTCGHPDPGAEVDASGSVPGWHFPARNYLLRSPLADVVMLDSQPVALGFTHHIAGSETSGEEIAWLRNTLDRADSRWRIVVGHHTIFSSGPHGRKNDATQQRMRALLPLLRKDHVDLYICGHDHDMELIGDLHRRNGDPLFLVSGAGSGTDMLWARKATGEPPTIWPKLPSSSYLGFAVLEIARDHLSVTFYDRGGTQTGGPFTIAKP